MREESESIDPSTKQNCMKFLQKLVGRKIFQQLKFKEHYGTIWTRTDLAKGTIPELELFYENINYSVYFAVDVNSVNLNIQLNMSALSSGASKSFISRDSGQTFRPRSA